MIETQLNIFDIVVIFIMFLSCMFAAFRGFVREVLSLGAWIGAGIVTIYFFPTVAEKLQPQFKNAAVAAGIGTLGIYVLALIGFSVLNGIITKYLKSGSDVGVLDNMFGLIFGAFRGAFCVSLGYLLVMFALGDGEKPDWIKVAKTRPYVEQGAQMLANAAPTYLHELSNLRSESLDTSGQSDISPDQNKGYSHESTHQLDKVIDDIRKE